MIPLQTFQSTVVDKESDMRFHVLVLPKRSLDRRFEDHEVLSAVGLLPIDDNGIHPSMLPHAVLGMLLGESTRHPEDALFAMVSNKDKNPIEGLETESVSFAEHVSYSDIVPIEQSPLSLTSLAGLSTKLAKAGAIATGIYVGISAADQTPLLLVTVPAGIIICGVGFSFAKWVEKNGSSVFDRLLLGRENRKETPTGESRRSEIEHAIKKRHRSTAAKHRDIQRRHSSGTGESAGESQSK